MNKILNAVLKGSPAPLKGYTIFTDAIQQMIKQRSALIKDDWKTLEKLANSGLGLAYASFTEICRTIGVLQAQSDEANEAFLTFLKFHASQKDTRKEFYAEAKKELLKKSPDVSPEWLKALDALAEGKVGNNVILEGLKNRKVEDAEMINSVIESTVAQAVRSVMGLTYAGFHNHTKAIAAYPFATHKDELVSIFDKEVNQFEKELEDGLKNIHIAIYRGESYQKVAENLKRILEYTLPQFGGLQATLRLYMLTLKEGKLKNASIRIGKISAKAGDLTRSAYAAYAAAYYLSLQSRNSDPGISLKKVLSKVKYSAPFPNGKNYNLSKMDTAKKGEYIEVAGFVESIQTRREGNDKLISKLVLSDFSGTSKIEAVGVYVHLRHVGLQEGAYCVLHGIWQTKSKINSNNPAVEIDKLAINEFAKKSWKVAFLDLADKFVDRWPGGLNMSYGLSPHVSKSKVGESKILGAGELIFKPFIR